MNRQGEYAERLSEELQIYGEDIDRSMLLDALACCGLRLDLSVGSNQPSEALFAALDNGK